MSELKTTIKEKIANNQVVLFATVSKDGTLDLETIISDVATDSPELERYVRFTAMAFSGLVSYFADPDRISAVVMDGRRVIEQKAALDAAVKEG